VEQLQSAAAVQQLQHVHNLKNVEEKLKQNGQPQQENVEEKLKQNGQPQQVQQDQALALALITSFSVQNLQNVEEPLKQNGQPQQDQALALALITSFSVKTRLSRGGLLLHRVRVKKLHRQDQ